MSTRRLESKGVDYLVIPCEPEGNKGIRPLYLPLDSWEQASIGIKRYQCPRCGQRFYGYHAASKHMGLVSNIMGTCKGR